MSVQADAYKAGKEYEVSEKIFRDYLRDCKINGPITIDINKNVI